MEQLIGWLVGLAPESWYGYVGYGLAALGFIQGALLLLAPKTKNTFDDKALALLQKYVPFLKKAHEKMKQDPKSEETK